MPKNINRRQILASAASGAAAVAVGAVIGHSVSWQGASSSGYPVTPYTLSKGAVEKFKIRERAHLSIDGIGSEVVQMSGTAVFRRYDPELVDSAAKAGLALSWSTALVKVDFLSLDSTGTSALFGKVHASLPAGGAAGALVQPTQSTQATYGIMGGDAFRTAGNRCINSVSPQFAMEELGETVSVGDAQIELGSEVSLIPPVGDVARTTGSYPLYSASGARVGTLVGADIEIGEIIERQPLGSSVV